MKLSSEELIALMESREDNVTEHAQLKERVLKLEHKLNELYDMLTDFRVNQIMGANATNEPKLNITFETKNSNEIAEKPE